MFRNLFSSHKTTDTVEKAILTDSMWFETEKEVEEWMGKSIQAYENLIRKAKGQKREQLLSYRDKFHHDIVMHVVAMQKGLNLEFSEKIGWEGWKFPFEI